MSCTTDGLSHLGSLVLVVREWFLYQDDVFICVSTAIMILRSCSVDVFVNVWNVLFVGPVGWAISFCIVFTNMKNIFLY